MPKPSVNWLAETPSENHTYVNLEKRDDWLSKHQLRKRSQQRGLEAMHAIKREGKNEKR